MFQNLRRADRDRYRLRPVLGMKGSLLFQSGESIFRDAYRDGSDALEPPQNLVKRLSCDLG